MDKIINKLILCFIIIFFYLTPLLFGNYTVYLIIKIFILSLYAISFNIMFGYCGLLSFGHAIFFSGSAYGLGIAFAKFNIPLPMAIITGIIVTVIFSIIVGFLSLRHKEIHFAMITLALSMLFWGVVMKYRSLTGGEDGITGISRCMSLKTYYYICISIVLICTYAIYKILYSDFGLLLKGIRENETRMEFCGHSVIKLRMLAMIISALFTGIAGMLWVLADGTVTPSIAHWTFSAVPVIASLIGGPYYFLGPIFGTFIYVIAEDFVTRFTLYWQIWLGIIVILIVLFFREGIVGTLLYKIANYRIIKISEKHR